jgi:hypothetical protein
MMVLMSGNLLLLPSHHAESSLFSYMCSGISPLLPYVSPEVLSAILILLYSFGCGPLACSSVSIWAQRCNRRIANDPLGSPRRALHARGRVRRKLWRLPVLESPSEILEQLNIYTLPHTFCTDRTAYSGSDEEVQMVMYANT